MKFPASFLIFLGVFLIESCFAVPVSVLTNDLSNSVEEDDDDTPIIVDDDFTTHGLERLSSAATCLVAGVEYTHGQQIYRQDQCEFCLCLDGEMFCWWQDCPPTMEGPCRDRGPFSPCISVPASPQMSSTSSSTALAATAKLNTISTSSTIQTTSQEMSSSQATENLGSITDNFSDSSTYTEQTETDFSSESPEMSTSGEPKHCIVMGREYQIGDKLPHDTGNCIECICGQGAKVTCSPHQCAPAGDEINDYRPPGPRQPIPDVF